MKKLALEFRFNSYCARFVVHGYRNHIRPATNGAIFDKLLLLACGQINERFVHLTAARATIGKILLVVHGHKIRNVGVEDNRDLLIRER